MGFGGAVPRVRVVAGASPPHAGTVAADRLVTVAAGAGVRILAVGAEPLRDAGPAPGGGGGQRRAGHQDLPGPVASGALAGEPHVTPRISFLRRRRVSATRRRRHWRQSQPAGW